LRIEIVRAIGIGEEDIVDVVELKPAHVNFWGSQLTL
jgi:hypothetical protein